MCYSIRVRGKLKNDGRGISLNSAIQVHVLELVISFKIVKKQKKQTINLNTLNELTSSFYAGKHIPSSISIPVGYIYRAKRNFKTLPSFFYVKFYSF